MRSLLSILLLALSTARYSTPAQGAESKLFCFNCSLAKFRFPWGMSTQYDYDPNNVCTRIQAPDNGLTLPGIQVNCAETKRLCTGAPACRKLLDTCCDMIVEMCRNERGPDRRLACFHTLFRMKQYPERTEVCQFICHTPEYNYAHCMYKGPSVYSQDGPSDEEIAKEIEAAQSSVRPSEIGSVEQSGTSTIAMPTLLEATATDAPTPNETPAPSDDTLKFEVKSIDDNTNNL